MEITFQILNEMAENHYKMKPYVHYFPQYEVYFIDNIVQPTKNQTKQRLLH